MPKTAAILIIGNEILSGKVEDANTPFLCRELRELGVEVRRIVVIPDEVPVIAAEVVGLSGAHDFVFTAGGVGPTHDDVTVEGIAAAFGVRVLRHSRLERLIRDFYKDRLHEPDLKMAEVPEGAELLSMEGLAFPVVVMRNVYIFPGIPEVLRRKFGVIRERFRDAPFYLRRVLVRGGEGSLAEHLRAVLREYPALLLGSYPEWNNPEYQVKLTLESRDPDTVEGAMRALLARLPAAALVRIE
jgi:molybdenum cofactor synthesis domain-containing protein